jgi:DNA-binding Xre family transcriptional regulator
LYYDFKKLIKMNEKIKNIIELEMFKNKINKLELSGYMNMSYPTMLSKLSEPGTFKISEAARLCDILNIELTELLNIKQ